ncbi:hypothetical protein Ae707Ps1_6275c [Pseudonocardia sp. Ae707_Ps1]|nr:hypothetical protein Ae707Ps1_6259c [Pseudonocardia sp. Ae707_Ps1]OLM08762.1 hypothetical protein Ae707Ps1_6275c [Pseudonocardia sp. Ae707_Ps1]
MGLPRYPERSEDAAPLPRSIDAQQGPQGQQSDRPRQQHRCVPRSILRQRRSARRLLPTPGQPSGHGQVLGAKQ